MIDWLTDHFDHVPDDSYIGEPDDDDICPECNEYCDANDKVAFGDKRMCPVCAGRMGL